VVATLAGALSAGWLLLPGPFPDQVLRAALLLSTTAFVLLSRIERLSFTHRALLAIGLATTGMIVLFLVFGWSWEQLHWWVSSQRNYESSLSLGAMRANPSTSAMANSLESVIDRSVAFEADNFAALTALKLMAGLALATTIYHRIARFPRGVNLGRFRDFRFSEHLGWAAAIPLIIALLPDLLRAKVAAFNLLLVTGTLYVLRGLAVAAFAAGLAGTGPVATIMAITAAFLLLPVVLGIGILLGVLDAGMDLRSRMTAPPARD